MWFDACLIWKKWISVNYLYLCFSVWNYRVVQTVWNYRVVQTDFLYKLYIANENVIVQIYIDFIFSKKRSSVIPWKIQMHAV